MAAATDWEGSPAFCPYISSTITGNSLQKSPCPYTDDGTDGCYFWVDQIKDPRSDQGSRTGGCIILYTMVQQALETDPGNIVISG